MPPIPSSENITVVARSPGLSDESVEIAVTLPTYKRPEQLLATIESVMAQSTARKFALVVMENDAERHAGADAVAPLFENGTVRGILIIAHERGNCCAYNAGWTTALSEFPNLRYVQVIDDDEIASPDWLERMCATAESLDADIVGGPQVPEFARPDSDHWRDHPVFSPPYRDTRRVEALYSSGNLLVSKRVLDAMPRPFLDTLFNFMGGGDSDFLSRAAAKGFRLGWCAEAPVVETIPARRLENDWIRSRSLRNGVISTLVEKRKRAGSPFGSLRVAAKSLALLAASPLRAFASLLRTGSMSAALYPVHVALGRVLAEFGYANEQYRHAEKN
ncbi:glycosyltransferase family 2 protein [Aquibium oceanicum]|uniref:Glycosyl transferase n=1 Tax=Aquibium oceanicum TaxID=1670800 RepID=A0A1L3SV83_9HYPH|nr:glycosyltransferase [Aquibium oceanicum]APH73329.1 glycosyl transferase [Aquibium oceanicum]